MNARSTGRVIALLLMTVVIGVVLFGVLRAQRSASTAPVAGSNAPGFESPVVGNDPVKPGAPGGIQDIVAMGREGVWTRVDPESGELQYKLTWATMDPEENGVIRLGSPVAFIFMGEQTLRVRAETARLLWPAREREPESGSLSGDVIAELLPSDVQGADPAPNALAAVTVRTPNIRFESQLGELAAPERVAVTGAGFDFVGTGLSITASDVDRRIRLIRLERCETLRLRPEEFETRASAATERGTASSAGSGVPGAPSVDLYRATLSRGVRLTQGSQSLAGEELLAFVRLTDGKLKPGAIANLRGPTASADEPPSGARASTAAKPKADEIALAWTGPLEVRLLKDVPTELVNDDVFVRMNSGAGVPASYADVESGGFVRGAVMQAGLTTLAGSIIGSAAEPIAAGIEREFEVAVPRIDFDLVKGVGGLIGAGEIRALDTGASGGGATAQTLAWAGRGDVRFDVSRGPVGAGGVVMPLDAIFDSGVRATGDAGGAEGDSLRVVFVRVEREGAKPIARLSRAVISGNAVVSSPDDGRVSAETIDIGFAGGTDGRRVRPVLASARGGAVAERDGESLASNLLEVDFEEDERGRTRATTIRALGDTVITARDGIEIRADELRGDQRTRVYDLTGEPVTIAQRREDGESRLNTNAGRFDANARTFTASGAGDGFFTQPGEDPSLTDRIDLSWTGGMVYDDRAGRAECSGDASAMVQRGANERHAGRGERLVVELTPTDDSAAPDGGKKPARRVQRATLEGGAFAGKTDAPAEVELRRYKPAADGAAERELEGLVFLSGPRVTLLGQAERLETPGSGRLLFEDRRGAGGAAGEPGGAGGESVPFRDSRGTTLFQWAGLLTWDRTTGEAKMTGGTRMNHLNAASGERVTIEAEELGAVITNDPANPDRARLERVNAVGTVRAAWKTVRVEAGSLEYDDANAKAIARAAPGSSVSALDTATGRASNAEEIEFDLRTGEWKVTRLNASGGN